MNKKKIEQFIYFWNHELMPFAELCIKDDAEIWANCKNAETEKDEQIWIDKMEKSSRVDWVAVDQIASMIYYVTTKLSNDENPISILDHVYKILGSEEYYLRIHVEGSTESNMYKKLASMIKYGMDIINGGI